MAVKKATTTDDIKADEVTPATTEDVIDAIVANTDPDVIAEVEVPGYVKVKSPSGAVTEVPEGILEALLDSGYKRTK